MSYLLMWAASVVDKRLLLVCVSSCVYTCGLVQVFFSLLICEVFSHYQPYVCEKPQCWTKAYLPLSRLYLYFHELSLLISPVDIPSNCSQRHEKASLSLSLFGQVEKNTKVPPKLNLVSYQPMSQHALHIFSPVANCCTAPGLTLNVK